MAATTSGVIEQQWRRLQEEWAHSAAQLQAALQVLGGSHVHPWKQLTTSFVKPPTEWPPLRAQLLTNLLRFRANYAQILVAWTLVCVIRNPFRAAWLLALAAGWFHALLVRRSVINVPLGSTGRVITLMHRELHAVLAVASLLWLLLTGTAWLLLTLALLPVLLVLVHASVCPPVGDLGALSAEVRHGLARAFRHKDADTEEMEGGCSEVAPPRDDELAKRVEQIRSKYRPPTSNKVSTE